MSNYLASLGPALADHLWQSTAFAVVAWLLTLTLRKNLARVRYAIWLAASIKFLVPFSLLVAAGNLLPHPKQPVAPVVYSAMDVMEEPFAAVAPPLAPVPVHVATLRERAETALPVCLGVLWLAGLGAVLFGWWNRWRVLSMSLHHATAAHEGREFELLRRLESASVERRRAFLPLLISAERMEPGIFGVFRPVLVWPQQLSARLDDEQIEAIIAHELTHVRRRDNLTALIHMLVEAAFWFHPLVWWMERQMVKEREQACDEAVVEMGGRAETYAESLLKTCRFCIESPLPCVAGVTGADLRRRVGDIVTGHALLRMTWPKKLLLATAGVCVVVAPVVLGQAKAAQRFMLAAIKDAPRPIQFAAHAMIAEEQTPAMRGSGGATANATPEPIAANSASDPAFEVATIRPANDNDGRQWWGFRLTPSGRLTVSGVPLKGLVGFSSIHNPGNGGQVSGGPSWAESQKWDITAEADPSTIPGWNQLSDEERMDRIKPMLLKLVVERFHLKVHTETRPYSVYAMVPAKGGVKLGGALKRVDPPPPHADPEETKEQLRNNKLPLGAYTMGPEGSWLFLSVRSYILASQIASNCRIDGMVVDQSGLDGYYDLTFKPDRGSDAPALQDQVEMQLGLRFEAKKVPMPTYVIDSAERPTVDGAELAPAAAVRVVMAQEAREQHQTNESVRPQMMAKDADPDWEVVTVKPSDSNEKRDRMDVEGRHVIVKNETVEGILCAGFGMQKNQIAGAPDWIKTEHWDVDGVPNVDGQPDLQQLQRMLRKVLEERFGLRLHHEQREMPVFALTVAKGGPKMTANTSDPKGLPGRDVHGGNGQWTNMFTNTSMSDLALMLLFYTDRPIVDQTGLTGRYDFKLQWTTDEAQTTQPDAPPGLFTAIQEQTGLKLEPVKAPADVLVIDKVERPGAN